MAANYILQDRTLPDKWAISINDEILQIDTSLGVSQNEPIIEDDIHPGDHYKIFIDDGELGIEDTVIVQNDIILLEDPTLGKSFQLYIDDGEFGYKTFPAYPITLLKKNLISGFHVFLNQYIRSRILSYDPLKLPDGTTF